ncbi:hypothetical protein K3G39_08755 [Pontibacter sp. HSC-14F20]|uniref:hypothetical protein n=1 Tax=Pontibacter sp. HSC-14F20 TaxID=2864136 RepID=UPI001C73CA17|nr:hypothetical protein [Pontibacter sp. HSC-14F20]MBX0333328.1 hypothetical protein [Pontibacter sp. HSC-14F20]
MNRTVFVILLVLQITAFFVWRHLGYSYGGAYLFLSMIVLLYFRRRYLDMKPFWGGEFSDVPKYFTGK